MTKRHIFILMLGLILLTLSCTLVSPKQNSSASPDVGNTQDASPANLPVTAISAGGGHVCALLNTGEVMCWGNNEAGQLGDGTYTQSSTPVKVKGLKDIVALAAGGAHTCAITNSGGVKCWGLNKDGELGNGTRDMSNLPVDVIDLTDKIISIAAGAGHTCVITIKGDIKCWGFDLYVQLGNGSSSRWINKPVDVIGLEGKAIAIAAGEEHTCAILDNKSLKCWGSNSDGELGIGESKRISKTPIVVPGMTNGVSIVTAGFKNTCAVMNNGKVNCWGWNGFHQFNKIPTEINSLNNISAISTNGGHTCAVISNKGIRCWGSNEFGQLGDGTNLGSDTPLNVLGLDGNAQAVATNFNYSCALMDDGLVKCWGKNEVGQLGNGTTENSAVPVNVIGLIPK